MEIKRYKITVESTESCPSVILELSPGQLSGIQLLRQALERVAEFERFPEEVPSIRVERSQIRINDVEVK